MSYLTSRAWWAGALERAILSAAAAMLAALGVPAGVDTVGVDVRHLGWADALWMAGGAAALSLLGSVAATRAAGPPGSPSLVDDRPPEPAR